MSHRVILRRIARTGAIPALSPSAAAHCIERGVLRTNAAGRLEVVEDTPEWNAAVEAVKALATR